MVLLPEDAAMTLAELRQMAARQQHQIEAQQQLLVAKEQRLKFLKQQEARHHNLAEQQLDTACLQNLRDKVETQEYKLRQLRALRGQVEQQKTNNGNLGAELDSIRALFSEKEKELNLAVNKVEELSRQLDEIRNNNNRKHYVMSSSASELENLRRELLYHTKLAEQQNNYICQQRENIAIRQKDIAVLDQKINELTHRLHRKRLLNEQLATQIHNASLSRNSNSSIINNGLYHVATIVTVEPVQRETLEPEHTQDDMAAKLHGSHIGDLGEFCLTKNDPKYQTLPYNTKFSLKGKHCEDSLSSTEDESWSGHGDYSSNNKANLPLSVVKPTTNMCNFSPRPFSSAYNSNNVVPKVSSQNATNKSDVASKPSENEIFSRDNIAKDESSERVLEEWSDATNNNDSESAISVNLNSAISNKSLHEKSKDQPKLVAARTIKPVVPPKPALPVKPILSSRQTQNNAVKGKTSDEVDVVDAALSVLQNKSSEKEKTAFSNYRERLLYYQCVPRYSNAKDSSQDSVLPKSKIATYFPKPSLQLDSNVQKDSSPNENIDPVEIPKRRPTSGQLPIKPKPLTIRKTPGLEPPKLKVQPVISTNSHRKATESHILANHLKTSINSSFLPLNSEGNSSVNAFIRHDSKDSEECILAPEIPPPLTNCREDSPEESSDKEVIPFSCEPVQVTAEKEELKSEKDETESYESETTVPKSELKSENVCALTDIETDDETFHSAALRRLKKGNLKGEGSIRSCRRVSFDPLALLLDAALEGELELVTKTAKEVPNPSAANDEGITALHNAICAGHIDVVTFLVEFGCDVNAQDSDGWTPLHCAASCNNLPMVKFLVERGACIFATTLSDHETAAEKCEEDEEGFDGCSEYLYSLQENLGVLNNGIVYAVYDYDVQNPDELSFKDGDMLTVLRKGDDEESEWWWSRLSDEEGYVPRNLLGLHPRVTCRKDSENFVSAR